MIGIMKKIIHIDMDAYYAAIEIRENPSLKGKPVVVGGPPDSRGVVSTSSYEARRYGIHSGMPSSQAWRLCPPAVFVYPQFNIYKDVTNQIRDIFFQYTDMVEPMSLDEAYLDVTTNKVNEPYATNIAEQIKKKILVQTKLTCSAGVSYNKFLAKIGSELNKPDGLTIIPPHRAQEILFNLPIEKFHGIGKVTAARMQKMGIKTGEDLYSWDLVKLIKYFGKIGVFFYYVVRGIDNRDIITESEPKSISNENTFHNDIDSIDVLLQELMRIAEKVSSRMKMNSIQGQLLTLKLKYDNFEQITRSITLPIITNDKDILFRFAEQLLVQNWDHKRKVRLIGVGISKLEIAGSMESDQMVLPFYSELIL